MEPQPPKPVERHGIRRGIYILPSLFTVGSLVCGYYAILSTLRAGQFLAAADIIMRGIAPSVATAVVGPPPPVARNVYRTNGLPAGITLEHYHRSRNPEVFDGFTEGNLWQELQRYDAPLVAKILTAGQCVIMYGSPEDDHTLNYLRDAVGMVMFFLANGGCAVLDPQMFRCWEPLDWRRAFIAAEAAAPRYHVSLLTTDEPTTQPDQPALSWFNSRGMRKFGRPDISVHNVPPVMAQPVVELCNRLIEFEAAGGIITDGQTDHYPPLPPSVCNIVGSLDDPEFNNTRIEITFM